MDLAFTTTSTANCDKPSQSIVDLMLPRVPGAHPQQKHALDLAGVVVSADRLAHTHSRCRASHVGHVTL